jgi:hypothetical protein
MKSDAVKKLEKHYFISIISGLLVIGSIAMGEIIVDCSVSEKMEEEKITYFKRMSE